MFDFYICSLVSLDVFVSWDPMKGESSCQVSGLEGVETLQEFVKEVMGRMGFPVLEHAQAGCIVSHG